MPDIKLATLLLQEGLTGVELIYLKINKSKNARI